MTADVYELMSRAEELPYGEARTVLVEDALRRAEAAADADLVFRVRMGLTTAYQYGGEPAKAFTTFSRCLAEFDRDPAHAESEHRLLWQMKWIISSLTKFPEIPLDRTRAVLDDMERRYRLGGHSLQAVYHYRHVVAQHIGDTGVADELFAKWRAAERDALSDCQGCDPSSMADHLAERGRDEDALAVAAPVLNAELDCSEQPQDMLTTLLPVYLRTGRFDEARDAHRRAYRLHRPHLADMGNVADHLWFCAVTGNEPRGLEILQRHLGWLDRAPSPFAAMRFAAAGALVLRRLGEIGADGLTVRRPAFGDRPAGDVALPVLREELERLALDLAGRFDARNGTSHQGDQIRALLAAEPLVERLPLTEHARAAATPPPAPPSPAPAAPVSDAPDASSVDDPDELLDLAERLWEEQDTPAALAAYARFDQVTGTEPTAGPAEGATPADWMRAARRLDGHGVTFTETGALTDAYDVWRQAREWFEKADEPVRALSVASRLGAVLATLGRRDEAEVLLTEAVEGLTALDADPDRIRRGRLRLAQFHMMGDAPDAALAALDGVEPGDGDVDFLRGQAHGMLGDHDATRDALGSARERFRESGQSDQLAQASMMYAQVISHVPDQDGTELLATLDEAVAHAPAATGAPMLRPFAHWERGRFLLANQRQADAVPDLVEAVAAFTALGQTAQADQARVDLAAAYLGVGRALEAAETIEEALATLPQDAEDLPRARVVLANAQRELREAAAADTFAEIAAAESEPGAVGHFLAESASVLTDLDMDAQAAERFLAAAEAFVQAGDPYRAVDCRRCGALCHFWARQVDQSLEAMAETRAALAGLPAENPAAITWHTALVDYDEARIFARMGRLGEALERADAAIGGFTALDETDARDTVLGLRQEITAAMDGDSDDS
ncbi:hypothetical protein [Actinomadura rupiterrae]|uniref:hypothetical protein n=1 Tax=Actinomadura rupiterrae TaxID=559627 RepID=UPI0020A3730A|nr:hypothetical protein [Actinomadura rupiterrae]MCP2335482.1 tetratricopeptide (TPR) repeat protein [Actinomadura rupiterrae]